MLFRSLPNGTTIENFDSIDYRVRSIQSATAVSANTGYYRLAEKVTPSSIIQTAHKMGITSNLANLPIITLGTENVTPLEMTAAYSTLRIAQQSLAASLTSEVMLEESLLGWKEFEMEVVRDKKDNCVIICSIENFDPMGVHTGDSITVAPSQTLTDAEYRKMSEASLAIMREIGVDTGGSNMQFAINPANGEMMVIEMNPRVSRSSALASKATGFPIAKIAAKLAVGYTLDEL